jgi:hypothetical protein
MNNRDAVGSIAGSSIPRANGAPTWKGAVTLETDMRAGDKLWLVGWQRSLAGADFISISGHRAVGGPRKHSTSKGDY